MLKGRRIVFTGLGEVSLEEFEVPADPDSGHIVVEADITLMSPGTEMTSLRGLHPGPHIFPQQTGYSFTGTVLSTHPDVKRFGLGDRVFAQARHATHAYLREDTPTLLRIPDSVSFEFASFTSLFAVALYGLRKAAIQFGESVLVIGAGLVGLLTSRLLLRTPVYPLAVADVNGRRLAAAERIGVDTTLDISKVSEEEVRSVACRGEGFDVVIDATGNPKAVVSALAYARKYGRVILLGSPHGKVVLENLFAQLDSKDITLIGANQPNNPVESTFVYPWGQRRDRELILEWLALGKLDVSGIPYGIIGADEAPSAYAHLGTADEEALTYLMQWRH